MGQLMQMHIYTPERAALVVALLSLSACRTDTGQRPEALRPGGAAWFTGDVGADFTDASVVLITDPGGQDVGVPTAGGSAISGNDVEYIALDYDASTDVLSVGIATYGIAGDVDGDGDAGNTSSWLSGLGGVDSADFSGSESFTVAFDIDEDGVYDVIAGVGGLSTDISGYTVAQFSGSVYFPALAFGSTLSDHVGSVYGSPTSAAPHLEFTIDSFSTLADTLSLTDTELSFSINAFVGSFEDAGIGEDFVPGVAASTAVCFDDDGDGHTTCDGDCDDDDDSVNPDADEVCDGVDNDCDGDIDEGFDADADGTADCFDTEECEDGLDNDGDGDIDEDCTGCTTYALGTAADYNIFVSEFYTGGLDVAGRVAAGTTVDLSGFSVGYDLTGGEVLIAGDSLTLDAGTVHGDAIYGVSASISDSVDFTNSGAASQGTPIDFAAEQAALQALSAALASEAATGTTDVADWGGITLTGSDGAVNVFALDGADLSAATQLTIDVPAGAVAVVNISGTSVSMSGFGIFLEGADETDVLYNFSEATALTMEAIGIRGTVLAPDAAASFSNGSFDGSLIALSLEGSAEGHLFLFDQSFEICVEEDTGL